MGNHCLWYINNPSNHFHYENDRSIWTIFRTGKCLSVRNLNHFPNWKETAQAGPFFKLENDCPQFNDMSVLPPNLESHFPLSAKGVISTIPNLSRKYANFILDRGFVRISVVCSSVGIYWSFTSPSWTLSRIK
jgi:hypothetical protein